MIWQAILKIYPSQGGSPYQEIEEKEKQVPGQIPTSFTISSFSCLGGNKKLSPDRSEKLKSFLGEDWDDYKDNQEALELWEKLLLKNELMAQGKVSDSFTAITRCRACGDVYVQLVADRCLVVHGVGIEREDYQYQK